MNKIIIFASFLLLIGGVVFGFETIKNTKKNNEKYLGAIYLKPSEKPQLQKIITSTNSIVVIPENKEIYGLTKNLDNIQEKEIKTTIQEWHK